MSQMDEVTKARILEQAEMLINVQSNFNSQKESKLDIFRNYNEILKSYGSSSAFQKSLENSKICCDYDGLIGREIDFLKKNQDESFLIAVNDAKGHVFTTVIKKYEEQGKEKYSAMLVNLGSRDGEIGIHHKYEEYVFFDKDKLMEALNFEKYMTPVADIYKVFRENSDESYTNIIYGKDQIIGNCYLKEIEKGIKAAMIPMSTIQETRLPSDYTGKILKNFAYQAKFKINNKTIETEKVHKDYFDLLANKNPDIADELQQLKESYVINKNIRDSFSRPTYVEYSQDEINKNIDIKTMNNLVLLAHKGTDVSKVIDPWDLNAMKKLVIKSILDDVSAFDELNKIPNNINEKYPRYFENAKKEVSGILSTEAIETYNKFHKDNKPSDLDKSILLANKAYGLYPNNAGAINIIALGYNCKNDKVNAIKYYEKNLNLLTEPIPYGETRRRINTLCVDVSYSELSKNKFESSLNYINKIDNATGGTLKKSMAEKYCDRLRSYSLRSDNQQEVKKIINNFFEKQKDMLNEKGVMRNMAKTLENVGNEEFVSGRQKEAEKYFMASSKMYYEYAIKYCESNEESLGYFKKALNINSENKHAKEMKEIIENNGIRKELNEVLKEYNTAKYEGTKTISERREIKKRLNELINSEEFKNVSKETKDMAESYKKNHRITNKITNMFKRSNDKGHEIKH